MINEILKSIKEKDADVFSINYIDTILNLKNNTDSKTFDRVISFFRLYFNQKTKWQKEAIADIYVEDFSEFTEKISAYCTDVIAEKKIRISSAEKFNLSVKEYEIHDYKIFVHETNNTAFIMNYDTHEIFMFIDDSSEIALVEFIRDIVIKDQENKGSIIMHAAAVEKNNSVIMISGVKGAGKSTLTLELICNGHYRFFTGDKLFLRVIDGKVIAKGWPDYPHIGVGTIRNFKVLNDYCKKFNIEKMNNSDKILLDFEEYYRLDEININSGYAELDYIIFPKFAVDEPSNVIKVDDLKKRVRDNIEFKEDFSMSQWHNFIPKKYNKEQQIQMIMDALDTVSGFSWSGLFKADDISKII